MSWLRRTGTGRNNIAWGGGSNTSGQYCKRTGTSRNSIQWLNISSNGTHNLLERTSTGRNNIRWNNLTFTFFTPNTKTYTSSTTVSIPSGCGHIDIFCVGGGGKGAKGINSSRTSSGGNGGNSGYTSTKLNITVSSGQTLSVVIGAGATTSTFRPLVYGGTSSVSRSGSSLCSATGGQSVPANTYEGDGGSGGGAAAICDPSDDWIKYAGAGGSNGSNGTGNAEYDAGKGQGTTTRAFGESSGTLYAGGGGGGGAESPALDGASGGSGGGGKGGKGSGSISSGSNGSANTGGGGGGGGGRISSTASLPSAGNGGSGIVLIRFKV